MPTLFFELVLFLVLGLVLGTQVWWPIIRGTPLFPVFRREGKLRREALRARQRQIERELENKLEQDLRCELEHHLQRERDKDVSANQ